MNQPTHRPIRPVLIALGAFVSLAALLLGACASDGVRTGVSVGYGYGYYGPRPWGYYGYGPGYVVVPDPDLPDIDEPVATPLPSGGGMHDFGPSAGFDDFGGFDDFDF